MSATIHGEEKERGRERARRSMSLGRDDDKKGKSHKTRNTRMNGDEYVK